jgi:hypothetical protein
MCSDYEKLDINLSTYLKDLNKLVNEEAEFEDYIENLYFIIVAHYFIVNLFH